MKDNSIRVRKNGAKNARCPQVQTPGDKLALGRHQKTATLIFYSIEDDKELAKFEIPEPAFNRLRAGAKKAGITLEKYFNVGFERLLPADETARSNQSQTKPSPATELFSPLLKLDMAVDSASALLELLAEKVLELRQAAGREGDEVYRGIGELAQSAIVNLRESLSAVSGIFNDNIAPAIGDAR